jgi:hypothetical protein
MGNGCGRSRRSERARDLEPDKGSIRESLGVAYLRARRFADAEAELQVLVELAANDHYAYFLRGRAQEGSAGWSSPVAATSSPAGCDRAPTPTVAHSTRSPRRADRPSRSAGPRPRRVRPRSPWRPSARRPRWARPRRAGRGSARSRTGARGRRRPGAPPPADPYPSSSGEQELARRRQVGVEGRAGARRAPGRGPGRAGCWPSIDSLCA